MLICERCRQQCWSFFVPLIRSCSPLPFIMSIAPPPLPAAISGFESQNVAEETTPQENGSTTMDTTPDEVGFIYPPPHIKGTMPLDQH